MDDFINGYQPDENYNGTHLDEGDYMAKVQNITFKPTQKGDPMMTVDLVIRESPIIFKHRIVKNEYFNANMTKFYDCFKIPRGNAEYERWIGRPGKVHIAKGKPNDAGMAYMEIKYLIVDPPAAKLGPQAAPAAQPAPAAPATPPWALYQAHAAQSDPSQFTDDVPF